MKYLLLLGMHGIDPNFWVSEEYFNFNRFYEVENGNWIGIKSHDDNQYIFPPLHSLYGFIPREAPPEGVWSTFANTHYLHPYKATKLDWEYIYNPRNFIHMQGKKWAVYRKNVRKWPRAGNHNYIYLKITQLPFPPKAFKSEINKLLIAWLEEHKNIPIHDSESLLWYMHKGENRKFLYDTDRDKIVGVNCWDFNYKYINFRWSICRQEPYLNEFLRYLFYMDPDIINSGKMVNDGGILDNPNIKAFKDKMNPIKTRRILQWKSKDK